MQIVESMMGRAQSLREFGNFQEAESLYRQVLSVDPSFMPAWQAMGQMALQTRNFEMAAGFFAKGISCCPTEASNYADLGICLARANRWLLAIQAYRQAIQFAPDHFPAINNLGEALRNVNQVDDSILCFHEALRLRPDLAVAHWNLALSLLVQGDFARGWQEFEWRLQANPHLDTPLPMPKWQGEMAPGHTILLRGEQGAGDCIQFLRYAPMVKARVGRVIVQCHDSLVSLARTAPGVDIVIPQSQTPPICDGYAMLLSLPGIFQTTADSIPNQIPYLRAEKQFVTGEFDSGAAPVLRVGLVWAGNSRHQNDANRSIPLAKLAPLFTTPTTGVKFYSLQTGPRANDLAQFAGTANVVDWSSRLTDYATTAAALSELDLLITVDTSIAHLAGALGRQVWTLLPFAPDWRWQLKGRITSWYPTMQLFRQQTFGNWENVVSEVSQVLAGHARLRVPSATRSGTTQIHRPAGLAVAA